MCNRSDSPTKASTMHHMKLQVRLTTVTAAASAPLRCSALRGNSNIEKQVNRGTSLSAMIIKRRGDVPKIVVICRGTQSMLEGQRFSARE
jgi:hypothetical protein